MRHDIKTPISTLRLISPVLDLQSPFQNIYFFQPKTCSKIDGKERNATGVLLTPATSEKSEGFVHDFTVVGSISCKRNRWFALLSPKFMNSDGNISLVKRKKDLVRVSNVMKNLLKSYLEVLNGTDSA